MQHKNYAWENMAEQQTTYAPICFVNPDNLDVTPYFSRYRECIDSPYDLIYWDRTGTDSPSNAGAQNSFCFSHKVEPGSRIVQYSQLASGYLGFANFVKKQLRAGNYQRIVFLTGNSAAIVAGEISFKYRGRYIVDVRDYFLEELLPYFVREKRALDSAGLCIVSSPAYQNFLKRSDFYVLHNDSGANVDSWREAYTPWDGSRPLVLASIGTSKNPTLDRQLIAFFANDERFELRFIGRGNEVLQSYVDELGATNVKIEGAFPASRTEELYTDVDVLLNVYGNHHPHFDHALSNKLYLAARLGRPILVSPDTYMEQLSDMYDLGLAFRQTANMKERILALFEKEATAKRERMAKSFIELVEQQNRSTMEKIREFLSLGQQAEE